MMMEWEYSLYELSPILVLQNHNSFLFKFPWFRKKNIYIYIVQDTEIKKILVQGSNFKWAKGQGLIYILAKKKSTSNNINPNLDIEEV